MTADPSQGQVLQPTAQLAAPAQPGPYPYSAYFGPWESPPTFTAPPADPAVVERIQLLVRHAVGNGPGLLATVREKQANDPKLAFLFGGDGHAYFKWVLFCATQGLPSDQPHAQIMPPAQHALPQAAPAMQPPPMQPPAVQGYGYQQPAYPGMVQQQQPWAGVQTQPPAAQPMPQQQPAASSMQLSPEVESGFAQVLDALTGSKDSIKAAQQWFMACGPTAAPGLARMIAMRCVAPTTPADKKLHVVYLVNDILFKGLAARPAGGGPASDPIATALQPMLGPILAATFIAAGKSEELAGRLNKILAFWGERNVYDTASITAIQQAMVSLDNPAIALATALAQQAAAAAAGRAAAIAAAHPPPQQTLQPPAQMPPQYPPQMAPPPAGFQPTMPVTPQQPPPTMQPGQYPPAYPPQQPMYPGGMGMQPHMPYPMQPPMQMPMQQPAGDNWGVPPDTGNVMGHHYHYQQQQAQQQPWGQAQYPGGYPPQMPTDMQHDSRGRSASRDGRRRRSRGSSSSRSSSGSRSRSSSSSSSRSPAPRRERERVSRFHTGPDIPAHLPPRDLAVDQPESKGTPEPEGDPVSSFTFPPGLLPALCKKRQESGARPYEPLYAEEIEAMGLPPPPTRTDYLASRLEQFYAEIRDYRPGLSRADVEDPSHSWHRQRLRRELQEDPEGLKQRWWRGGGRRVAGGRGDAGRIHADGTFTGTGNFYAGLGAHVVDSAKAMVEHPETAAAAAGLGTRGVSPAFEDTDMQPAGGAQQMPGQPENGTGMSLDDMYQSYRSQKAGGYHAMIMANAAKAQSRLEAGPRRAPPRA